MEQTAENEYKIFIIKLHYPEIKYKFRSMIEKWGEWTLVGEGETFDTRHNWKEYVFVFQKKKPESQNLS